MKTILRALEYYALIPFAASLPGFIMTMGGLSDMTMIAVPLFAAVIVLLLKDRLDMEFAAKVWGLAFIILLLCFTVMMVIASGGVEGVIMSNFSWLIFPFAPIMLMLMLMGENMLLFSAAMLTYLMCFFVSVRSGGLSLKKLKLPAVLALVCIAVSGYLYSNRPAVKYGGHGFDYMFGYSSTDFTDYTVYSRNSRLAVLDEPSAFVIENEADMPVLDGAEACYPLYAAFAKAVYKDIDVIESNWISEGDRPVSNGKIVTFTNTVRGFSRLLNKSKDLEKYLGGADMFFGARPSESQLLEAEELGVGLDITPIAKEAFVFFVEEDNPVDGITSEQIRAIYHGDITNWNQLGGKNQEILAFQRPHNSGSQTMMEYFMGDVSLKEPLSYEMVSAMSGIIHQVAQYANEEGALGYSFRYFLEELHQEENVKMLSVDGVYPSLENIKNGTYPLTADVCLITRAGEYDPDIQLMKDFILSEQGRELIEKTGYASLDQ